MISHEMSTPLATIIFFLDFIYKFLSDLKVDRSTKKNDLKGIKTKRDRAIKYTSLI